MPSSMTLDLTGSGATGTQVSPDYDALVCLTFSTQVTLTLGGSPVSTVVLKICETNSAVEGDWMEVGRTETRQPTIIAVTVGAVIGASGQIIATVKKGWFVKAVASGVGTHSEAFVSGVKTLYQ